MNHLLNSIAIKTAYEGTVINRAMARAGQNPHLKGHIHEVLVKDYKNVTNLLNGNHTELTKSTTAKTVDLVTKNGGKIVERLQLKDTLSDSGVRDTVKRVLDGQYQSAKLVGTEETTKAVNAALEKAGATKRMTSSGISSNTTTRLAQQAGATGSGCLTEAVKQAAKSGGAIGAGVGAGIEVIKGAVDLYNGKRDLADVAIDTTKAGIKGGVIGAASTATLTATVPTLATVATATTLVAAESVLITVVAPVAIAVGVGWAASKLWDSIFD